MDAKQRRSNLKLNVERYSKLYRSAMPWLLKELDEDNMDTFLSGLLAFLPSPSTDTKAVVEGLIKDGLLKRIRQHITTCVTSMDLSQEESMSRALACIKSLRLISETAASVRRPGFGSNDIQAIMERLDPLCHNPSTAVRALCIRGLVVQEFPISAGPVQEEPKDEEEDSPDLDEEEDPDSDEEGDDSDSDEGRTRARMSLETCNVLLRVLLIRFPVVIAMRNNISALINQKEESLIMPTSILIPVATSRAMKKVIKTLPKKGFAIKKTQIPVLSFEQKKDLSQAIQTLDGPKLERVIQIIHEGVPEIRNVRSISPQAIHCS